VKNANALKATQDGDPSPAFFEYVRSNQARLAVEMEIAHEE
jgi:hypothetical protein